MEDITAFVEGRNKELAGFAEKVLKPIGREVEEKGFEALHHGRRNRGREQGDCVVQLSGRKDQE